MSNTAHWYALGETSPACGAKRSVTQRKVTHDTPKCHVCYTLKMKVELTRESRACA